MLMVLNQRPLYGRRRGPQPVARGDPGDDRAAAAAVPEHLGGAVVGGPQHDVERLAVGGGESGLSLRLLQQQVVGDEQLDHRGDRHRLAVAVGDELAGVAVQHHGGDVGAGLGGLGRGLPARALQAVERGGGLVGRRFGQGCHVPMRCDDRQLRDGRAPAAVPYTLASQPAMSGHRDNNGCRPAVTSFDGRRRMALLQVFPEPESGLAAPSSTRDSSLIARPPHARR